MSGTELTALFIVGVVVVCVTYDLIIYAAKGNDSTISRTLLAVSERYAGFAILVAFLTGVLFGHLFLPQHTPAP